MTKTIIEVLVNVVWGSVVLVIIVRAIWNGRRALKTNAEPSQS